MCYALPALYTCGHRSPIRPPNYIPAGPRDKTLHWDTQFLPCGEILLGRECSVLKVNESTRWNREGWRCDECEEVMLRSLDGSYGKEGVEMDGDGEEEEGGEGEGEEGKDGDEEEGEDGDEDKNKDEGKDEGKDWNDGREENGRDGKEREEQNKGQGKLMTGQEKGDGDKERMNKDKSSSGEEEDGKKPASEDTQIDDRYKGWVET